MQFNSDANLDPSRVSSSRGRGGGIAVGGGIGGLLILLVAVFLGVDPSMLTGGRPGPQPQQQGSDEYAHCRGNVNFDKNPECRWVAYDNSIQTYWKSVVQGYQDAQMRTFTQAVSTACGQATSQVGPFYCPADKTVYLDKGFFAELERSYGGDASVVTEAYVLAHEYGHHVQNLTGVMRKVQQDRTTGPTSAQVRLELQADCYAGVWFANAEKQHNAPISAVTQDDLNRALKSARAIGDDRIQERATGRVDRESWTHGSAENRMHWLQQGFSTGDPNQCNTFAAGAHIG